MFFSYFPNRYCPNDERMWSCSRKFYITVAFSIISCGIPTISSLMVFLCSSKVRGQCLKMLAFKYSFPVKKNRMISIHESKTSRKCLLRRCHTLGVFEKCLDNETIPIRCSSDYGLKTLLIF